MAAVISKPADVPNEPQMIGQFRVQIFDLALDNSYPTGGYALTLVKLGLNKVNAVVACGGGPAYSYDGVNQKLKAFVGTTGLEVANAVDLSGVTAQRIMVYGN